ncbi:MULTISPECIES: hypothetical protein [Leptolyngbya]|uniref:hypothetical protein n=1 Tax=Leptolyngbya TaxID=47251 RepID=UPI001683600C|nr:hypothetical protein [Leptolyngbya sp. FACHB-1624]MBD1856161.1 hypothetical protein [Leptolyngbya sp. FACHB-1624]
MKQTTKRKLTTLALTVSLLAVSGQSAFASQQPRGSGDFFGSLLQQVQDFLGQIAAKPQELLAYLQAQLGTAQEEIAQIAGELGLIDPDEGKQAIESPQTRGNTDMPTLVKNQGTTATIVSRSVAQTTLSKEGQRQSKENLEGIIQTAADSRSLAEEASAVTSADSQAAQTAQQTAQESSRAGQESAQDAQEVDQLGNQAQSRTSSQDILKLIARQNGGQGSILARLSQQLSGNSGQLGTLSGQLANNSGQNANLARLQAAQVQIAANQSSSLETLKQQGAANALTLSEMNEQIRGQRQADLIARQAEGNQLMKINSAGFRLMR